MHILHLLQVEYALRKHVETMFKDWWKQINEEFIPKTDIESFVLVELGPFPDQVQVDLDSSRDMRQRSDLEILTLMLNHQIVEVHSQKYK